MTSAKQHGFSLVTAIFLLVVLSGLGAMMVSFFTAQQQSSALDVLGVRVYQAARAGVEWGAFQVLPNSAAAFASNCRAGATSQVISPLAGSLAPFTVTVSCSAISKDEGARTAASGNPLWLYSIVSVASYGANAGSPDFVERRLEATIGK